MSINDIEYLLEFINKKENNNNNGERYHKRHYSDANILKRLNNKLIELLESQKDFKVLINGEHEVFKIGSECMGLVIDGTHKNSIIQGQLMGEDGNYAIIKEDGKNYSCNKLTLQTIIK